MLSFFGNRRFLMATVTAAAAIFAIVSIPSTAAASDVHAASVGIHPQVIIPGVCTYTSAEPELSYGNTGTAVKQVQCELNTAWAHGSQPLAIDGVFGDLTRNTVEEMQACAGIAQDGIVGPISWRSLDAFATGVGCTQA
jgi:peptidoglycan hydrolase-like protein with peptidoglycan-binding domain